jgi:hypothetical protein
MRNDARPIGEHSAASPVGGQHRPLEVDRSLTRDGDADESVKQEARPTQTDQTLPGQKLKRDAGAGRGSR